MVTSKKACLKLGCPCVPRLPLTPTQVAITAYQGLENRFIRFLTVFPAQNGEGLLEPSIVTSRRRIGTANSDSQGPSTSYLPVTTKLQPIPSQDNQTSLKWFSAPFILLLTSATAAPLANKQAGGDNSAQGVVTWADVGKRDGTHGDNSAQGVVTWADVGKRDGGDKSAQGVVTWADVGKRDSTHGDNSAQGVVTWADVGKRDGGDKSAQGVVTWADVGKREEDA
ncbi:hypothetical protein B0H65DRAFT_537267 [Neurospora tetraspora]|uniref:Uncharacterized protein n=1 Tax=Neurospora tetraspora TaxID=94610 RepID=A0AAE0JK01_9PEZI|nr:hypothetical protein B0H65DRAFT_537267 [Neurospora tetraspora]